ncbi:MAG: D-tyrosyl-tRNA(Tyr) deacylase [Bdellovibrionales bacterium]|nr:D-tyrosyl-tRNA(Tyr) deacylase [Bdellovibrionales bacterium]
MKAVLQRVLSAKVEVEGKVISSIDQGLLTLLGIERGDKQEDLEKLIQKIINLRIFEDEQGKMNLSLLDIKGQHLIVSQFTLLGDCSKGRRPHFMNAEQPERAKELYMWAIQESQKYVLTQGGQFAADMKVELVNDGPVTIML